MVEEEEVVKRPKNTLTIQGDDFILEQTDPGSMMFDLKLKQVVHGKTGDREEFKIDAYGIALTYAFLKIAIYRTAKQDNREVTSLMKFIQDYKKACNTLGKTFSDFIKSKV